MDAGADADPGADAGPDASPPDAARPDAGPAQQIAAVPETEAWEIPDLTYDVQVVFTELGVPTSTPTIAWTWAGCSASSSRGIATS
ncbi:MAG: hypothetical protein R3F43_09670 [bacterium]